MAKYVLLGIIFVTMMIVFPVYETILAIISFVLLLVFNVIYRNSVSASVVVSRFIENTKIFNGDSTYAGVIIENRSIFPLIGYVYDYTSMTLSYKQKETFFIFLPPKSSKKLSYRIIGSKRGDHHLGPTMVELKDIFMQTFSSKDYDTVDFVTVFPSILPHNEFDKSILQPYGEIRNPLPIFEDLTKIQGIREYQSGDEIRKINWKISAKHNKLYVNYYTPSVSSGTIIFLNLYRPDYDVRYPDFYEEFAIEVATTVIFELYNYNQEIGLVANGQIQRKSSMKDKLVIENPNGFFEIPISSGNTHISTIFELLARIYSQSNITLLETLKSLSIQIPWGTAVMLITPKLDNELALFMYEISRKGHEIFIYNVHPNRPISSFIGRSIKSYNTIKVESTIKVERVL
ncbi:MAG: DUF58 domain-containing protein [Brevinematales bacterium]|nr:DUF58 domain-containing protein [Brevinematales bacterium]